MIPYGRQEISQQDIDAVIAVLKSEYLTQGSVVPRFEDSVSNYCLAKYAIAVNSATSALHIACLALGVGDGDQVWTSSITFVASANCALYCGATVDFVDINPQTYNMCIGQLEEKLIKAEKYGKLPKVLIPVHLSGQSCDMSGIFKLSQRYGFKIIEDASHAIGGKYNGEPIGNCRYSDITIFSFHPVKIITTGEGGMAVTNNAKLAKHMCLLRSHGICNVADDMQAQPTNEIWNYQQIDLGFNYRMTDIQAALGISQMTRLAEFVLTRNVIADRYNKLLNEFPLQTPHHPQNCYSSYHLYVIRLNLNEISKTQRQVHDAFHAKKIMVNLHYIPVYRQPYFEKMGFKVGYCPLAEQYYSEAISLPIYPKLTQEHQDKVVSVLREMLST